MKKLWIASLAGLLVIGGVAQAETIHGKVLSTKGKAVTIQQKDGTIKSLQTNNDTAYRKKLVMKKNKIKHGRLMEKGKTYYEPLVETSDWIEITYTPTDNGDDLIAETITIYED